MPDESGRLVALAYPVRDEPEPGSHGRGPNGLRESAAARLLPATEAGSESTRGQACRVQRPVTGRLSIPHPRAFLRDGGARQADRGGLMLEREPEAIEMIPIEH